MKLIFSYVYLCAWIHSTKTTLDSPKSTGISKRSFYSNSELFSPWKRSFVEFGSPETLQWNYLLESTLPCIPITQKCRNQITSPFGVKTDHSALIFALQLKIQPEPLTPSILDQLNGNSCFPHRDISEKLVSRKLDFHCLPVYQWASWQTEHKFEFPRFKNLWEALFDETRVYRLRSNHSDSRRTDLRFEFSTSQNTLERSFRWNPAVSIA